MSTQLLVDRIIAPISGFLGDKLTSCFYHDVFDSEALTTNGQGIDIIAQQVELCFDKNRSLFLGWNHTKGWFPYTMDASTTSFCVTSERFRASEAFWQQCVSKRLSGLEVYGYLPNSRPHLILLSFEGTEVAIANSSLEFDFVPVDAVGDDVWILMNSASIQSFIQQLGLERLKT